MKFSNLVQTVDSHTAGEPARVITGGMPFIPGRTMANKRAYFREHLDELRTAVMLEPRGHSNMFGSMLVAPTEDKADFGILFLDSGGYLNMCVHGSIAAVTVAIETGIVRAKGHFTPVCMETPAGLVYAEARMEDDRVRDVAITNIPAFVFKEDIALHVPSVGRISIDIAFGGNFFALVNANELGLPIHPDHSTELAKMALAIRDEANRMIEVKHPTMPHINSIDLVEIYSHVNEHPHHCKNVVVFGDGQIDRSPCGTGTCAKMAAMYAKGQLDVGEVFTNESIIGTKFIGQILKTTEVGEFAAVVPQVKGSSYITGFNQLLIDDRDPVRYGFMLK